MPAKLEEQAPETTYPPPANRGPASVSGVRKAAVLLISLGDQASAKVVSQLSDDEVQRVSKEVAKIRSISTEQVETVLDEFYNLMLATDYVVSGGIDYARKMLVTAFGPDDGIRLLDKLPKDLGRPSSFRSLQKVDAQATGAVSAIGAPADDRADSFAPGFLEVRGVADVAS